MKEIIVNVDNYNENYIKTIEGDNLSEVYKIYICKNKRRIDLTNKIAIMAYVNEYGNKKSNILALNITNASQGEIELPITNVISNENGVYACQVAIYGENNSLEQTAPFNLIVENNIFSKISNAAINSTDFHILSEAIKTTNAYGEKLKEGTENIELQYANKLHEINSQLDNTYNKQEVDEKIIHMPNMGQDVKEAMSGGSVAVVGRNAVTVENIMDKNVTRAKLNFMEIISKNIFDKNNVQLGGYYSTDGEWRPSEDYCHSGFISVTPSTTYTDNIYGFHIGWDINKKFVGVIEKTNASFTTQDNCYYISIACPVGSLNTAQVNKGNKLLDYDQCKYKDSGLVITLDDIEGIKEYKFDADNMNFLAKTSSSKNLFDKSKILKNKVYNNTNGAISSNTSYSSSDFIQVENNKNYRWYTNGFYCLWDSSKQFVKGASGTSVRIDDPRVMYLTTTVSNLHIDEEMVVEGTELPHDYIPYKSVFSLTDDIIVKESNLDVEIKVLANNSNLKDKIWNVMGDSISSINYANKRYWEIIRDKYNMQVNNYGISGTRIAVKDDYPNAMCERYIDMQDDADIITVFGGTNDYGANIPLGDNNKDSKDKTTFYGALNVLCEGLVTKFPGKRIGFFTPLQRHGTPPYHTRWIGYQEAIKYVCGKYNIPVLDLNLSGGIAMQIESIANEFSIDGLHPNDKGHELLARRIEPFIEQL